MSIAEQNSTKPEAPQFALLPADSDLTTNPLLGSLAQRAGLPIEEVIGQIFTADGPTVKILHGPEGPIALQAILNPDGSTLVVDTTATYLAAENTYTKLVTEISRVIELEGTDIYYVFDEHGNVITQLGNAAIVWGLAGTVSQSRMERYIHSDDKSKPTQENPMLSPQNLEMMKELVIPEDQQAFADLLSSNSGFNSATIRINVANTDEDALYRKLTVTYKPASEEGTATMHIADTTQINDLINLYLTEANEKHDLSLQEKNLLMIGEMSMLKHDLGTKLTIIFNTLFIIQEKMRKNSMISNEYLSGQITKMQLMLKKTVSTLEALSTLGKLSFSDELDVLPSNISVLQSIVSVLSLYDYEAEVDRISLNRPDLPSKRDRIKLSIQQGVDEFYADHRYFERIIANLLGNALKYSEDEVALTISQKNGDLVVEVADKGIGISPEDMERIFEPYSRASNTGEIKGTGIGLSIVKKAVNRIFNGSIEVASEVGVGSKFTVRLPIKQRDIFDFKFEDE